jgi:hypothetical protein
MPVTYAIDPTKKLIRTRCAGPITLQEVIDHFHTLGQDPTCPDRLDVLLDVSEAQSLPQSAQIRGVSEALGKLRKKVRFGACAIVASSDAFFGMMRVFEAMSQEYFRVIRVFRAAPEAEEWLRSQQMPAGRRQGAS